MRRPLFLIVLLGASLVPCVAATGRAPAGWFLAGSQPQSYSTGVDASGVAFLTSSADVQGNGFGSLMQSIQATNYVGKRVRFSATVRSENLTGWAGLWMRVDQGTKPVAFDNMQTRAIKGTTGWTTYDVVLDVPADATSISFGALVSSNGGIWLRGASFELVGLDVPTTGMPMQRTMPLEPVNLDFRQ